MRIYSFWWLIVLIGIWVGTTDGRTDSPASPYAWVTTSESRRVLFKMVPAMLSEDGQEVVRESTGVAYSVDLRDWALVIARGPGREAESLFVNAKTGELIYEEEGKFPVEPILLDASGKRVAN